MSDPPSPPEFRTPCFSKLVWVRTVCLPSVSLVVPALVSPGRHTRALSSHFITTVNTHGALLCPTDIVHGAELELRPLAHKAEIVLCCTPRLCTLLLKRVFSHEWGKLGTQSCFQVLYVFQSGKSIQVLSTRPDFQAHRDADATPGLRCFMFHVSCPRCVLSVLMARNPSQAIQGGLSGQK